MRLAARTPRRPTTPFVRGATQHRKEHTQGMSAVSCPLRRANATIPTLNLVFDTPLSTCNMDRSSVGGCLMRSRYLVTTLVMFSAAILMSSSAWAQTKSWSVPRTPWGDPDIQGLWPANDMQGTPYERPESFGTRATLNDKEFAERQAARERQVRADGEVFVPQGQRAGIGGPSHWSAGERGNPQRQASLVVDPPNGRIPPMTEEGKKRIELARSTYYFDFP